jgi:hypothetical protein
MDNHNNNNRNNNRNIRNNIERIINVQICPKDKMYLLERPANIQWAETKPVPGTAGFTRNIDKSIHIDYWKNVRKMLHSHTENAYFKGQKILIKLVAGCEKPIFNDPTANYPFRNTFRGTTGTMTNIITGGFFHLYLHVLKVPGIEVNVCTDLVTMFDHLTKYAQYEDGFHMEAVELIAVKEIISILMKRKDEIPHMDNLFTSEWFDKFEKLNRDTHKRLISVGDDTFYWAKPTLSNLRRGGGFETGLKALFPPECALEWRGDSIIGDYPDRPRYLSRDPSWGPVPEVYTGKNPEISAEAIKFLNVLRDIFITDKMAGEGGRRKTRRRRKSRATRSRKQRR